MNAPETEVDRSSRIPWGRFVFLGTIILLFGLRPISSDSIWWNLVKGDAVLSGSIAPSASLLYESTSYDADWLSGVPASLTYLFLDIPGLVLMRIFFVGLFIAIPIFFWKQALLLSPLFCWSVIGIAGIATLSAWDPGPLALEVLLAAWLTITVLSQKEIDFTRLAERGFVVLVWANFAPHGVFSLLIASAALFHLWESGSKKQSEQLKPQQLKMASIQWGLFFVLLCCTPRGFYGIYDSLIQTMPLFFVDSALLVQTDWRPLIVQGATIELCAFVVLSIISLILLMIERKTFSLSVFWLTLQWLAWTCAACMPIVALIQFALIVVLVPFTVLSLESDLTSKSKTVACSRSLVAYCLLPMTFFLVGASVVGWNMKSKTRLGWGMSPRLEIADFQVSLDGLAVIGSAHCGDIRSAGMLALVKPGSVQPWTTPTRALIDGTFRDYANLNQEFALGWDHYHPREDGSHGGWYLRIADRKMSLVLFSAENTKVARMMLPTKWRPLSNTASVIPYGWMIHQKLYSAPVRNAFLRQFHFAIGLRQIEPPALSSSLHYTDLAGLVTRSPDRSEHIRQIRFLFARQNYLGAIRLLAVQLKKNETSELREIFRAIIEERAFEEFAHAGQASLFRTLCLMELTPSAEKRETILTSFGWTAEYPIDEALKKEMLPSVKKYLQGELQESLELLSKESDSPEIKFARELLLLSTRNFPPSAIDSPKELLNGLNGFLGGLVLLHEKAPRTKIGILAFELYKPIHKEFIYLYPPPNAPNGK